VFIVSEGEVFLNRFRILKVNNASLDFEEFLPDATVQRLSKNKPASPSV